MGSGRGKKEKKIEIQSVEEKEEGSRREKE